MLLRLIHSRWSFVVLQALDFGTTLLTFHLGGLESNPIVAHLMAIFGVTGGLLCSKTLTTLVIFRVRKLIHVANLAYCAIILWNGAILVLLAMRHGRH